MVCVFSLSLQEEKEEQRSSKRARLQPVHYGEEQAQQLLQAQELLDLRHAIQASMESDDSDEWGEESPEEPPPSISSGDEKEEEEERQPLSSWTREVKKTQ